MESVNESPLLLFGSFLLAGYVAHTLGQRTHIPRVVLLLLVGILAGPQVLDLVPAAASDWFPIATQAALSVLGFELGEKFLGKRIRQVGMPILILSVTKVAGTALVVFVALKLANIPTVLALLLAGIAPATDPASTVDVIHETRAQGELTDTTQRLVAIDDAWGIILFSLCLAAASSIDGNGNSVSLLMTGLGEIFGAILVGVLLGLPMAKITGRVSEGELTLIETLGFVFICGGVAALLDFSYILACMSMGCVVANFARHHTRPFHAIENVQQPFLVVFFLLAGYHADLLALAGLGVISVSYMLARVAGKLGSCYLGATWGGYSRKLRTHIGWCTLSQAGVALGLALLASQRFPDYADQIMAVAVGTSVLFEILGPIVTRLALSHAGEMKAPAQEREIE